MPQINICIKSITVVAALLCFLATDSNIDCSFSFDTFFMISKHFKANDACFSGLFCLTHSIWKTDISSVS